MRLNKTTSHALRVLIDCAASDGQLVKVADISARLGITLQNVFKIVHLLSRAGLISAVRGRNGGVRLARPAGEISIGAVVRAMEATEIEIDTDGEARGRAGQRGVAGVNRVLDDALEAFISVLDQHTVADMAGRSSVARKDATTGRAKPAARAAKPARATAPSRAAKRRDEAPRARR